MSSADESVSDRGSLAHTNRGKWAQSGVPHRGWQCVGVDDLGEPSALCEMCESVEIRYVHQMSHPDYAATLFVGCVCAEHMEQDYVSPRLREKALRTLARRRSTWKRRKWRSAYDGQLYLNTEGYSIAVFRASHPGTGWKLAVLHRDSGRRQDGTKTYSSPEDDQEAGLSALLWAKDHLQTSEWLIRRLRRKK